MTSKPGSNPEAGDCLQCLCNSKTQSSSKNNQVVCHDYLKHWGKWLNRRKAVHKRLEKLGRTSGDMLMNLGDDMRLINEERQLFWNTKIEDQFDKYRGNPAFWNLPLALPNKERPFYRNPTHFAVQSKEDKNEIPIIHYVGTPAHITKEEKDICHGKRNLKTLWQSGNYRASVLTQKESKIHNIQPHRPEHDHLIVLGKKINLTSQENGDDKLTTISNLLKADYKNKEETECCTDTSKLSQSSQILIPKTKFRINNIDIYENCHTVEVGKRSIKIIFEYELDSTLPQMKTIYFENRGSTTIRFYWSRYEKFRLFREFPESKNCPFYFNKNAFLLIPGQKVDLPVWFKVNKHGNYVEIWELGTIPKLWDADFRLLVYFQGFAYIKNFKEKTQQVNIIIDSKIRDTVVKDIVSDILDNLKYPSFDQIACTFDEEQLFESANQKICLANREPKYLYNKNIVRQLKKFYRQVKQTHHSEFWNMSIENLRKITRERDILVFSEKKVDDLIRAKNRRFELQNSDVTKERNASTVSTNSILEKETYFQKLQKLLQNLERPNMIKNVHREKHAQVYNIFKANFNKISHKLYEIDCRFNCRGSDFPSMSTFSNLEQGCMAFEKFDDVWVSRTNRVLKECKMEYPMFAKSPFLKSIPADDFKRIYKIYFNRADVEDNAKNKKKSKVEDKVEKPKPEPKKTNKGDKEKSTKTKSELPQFAQFAVKENFDPFSELFSLKDREVPEMITSKLPVPSTEDFAETGDLFYERYMVVYTYLGEAVDAMVDCIETHKTNSLTTDILSVLQDCNTVPVLERSESTDTIKEAMEQEKRSTKGTVKSIPVVKLRSSEDNIYFNDMIKRHWKQNENTKRYIINGKIDSYRKEEGSEVETEPLVNIFTDPSEWMKPRSLEEYSTCESKCVQTSDVDESYAVSNILLTEPSENAIKSSSVTSEHTVKSTDMFYFLDESSTEEDTERLRKIL